MTRDIDILKCLLTKENYDKYLPFITVKSLCKETDILIQDFAAYYEKFDHEQVDFSKFKTFFHHLRHTDLKTEDRDLYDKLFINIQQPIEDSTIAVMDRYKAQELGTELTKIINDCPDPEKYAEAVDRHLTKATKHDDKLEFLNLADLSTLLAVTDDENGYHWRLRELDRCLGTVMPGRFGVVAGCPDSGKTSLLIGEITYLAQQLTDDETILWLNNENIKEEIGPRVYSAMLGARRDQINEYKISAEKRFAKLGGLKIQVLDIQNQSVKFVERLLKKLKPRIVVIDMLDHVKGFSYNQNVTVDHRAELLYQWALQMSCVYKCTIIGVSQMNGEAMGKPYPKMQNLKGSQISKQGAATWQLMIGRRDDLGYENIRYLSAPKSKRGDSNWRCEVEFDRERSLFISEQSPFRYFNE